MNPQSWSLQAVKNVARPEDVALNQFWWYNQAGALPATPTSSPDPPPATPSIFMQGKMGPQIVFHLLKMFLTWRKVSQDNLNLFFYH